MDSVRAVAGQMGFYAVLEDPIQTGQAYPMPPGLEFGQDLPSSHRSRARLKNGENCLDRAGRNAGHLRSRPR